LREIQPNLRAELIKSDAQFSGASRRHADLATGFESMAICLLRLDRAEGRR